MEYTAEEKLLIKRANDTARLSDKQYRVHYLGFLTPHEAAVIKRNMPPSDGEKTFFGGYEDAERCIFAVVPEYAEEGELRDLISVLEITGRDIGGLSHRDYLGSILGLGIKREMVGDILVLDGKCLVFVISDIADYIADNLGKIGRCGIKIRRTSLDEVIIPERKTENIRTTVASLRLDCIVAAALKTSRSRALPYISSGRVFVNWEERTDCSFALRTGDVFSIRGEGRFKLSEEIGETKKGRISVCIERAV